MKQNLFKKFMAVLLSVLISQGLYSCKRNDVQLDDKKLSNLSGEEIFKGIFFLEGQLPNEVDFLKKRLEVTKDLHFDKNVSSEKGKIINEVVAEIKRSNPQYFVQLKDALYSEDYNKLNESIQLGGDLLYVGLVKSQTMKSIMPEYNKIVKNLDMDSYDFQEKTDVNKFITDVQAMQPEDSANSPQCVVVAGTLVVVAAAVVVTVAVAVSWIGAVQVAGYALAFTSVRVVESAARTSGQGVLSNFDSQLLTKDLVHAIN